MRLGYIIIYVPDVGKAVRFYEDAFQLKCRFQHEEQYAEMETGGTALAFVNEGFVSSFVGAYTPNRSGHAPAGAEVAFVVENVQHSFDQAVKAGATPHIHPMQKPWGQTVSYVRDLNGFLVELCSAMGG